MSIDESRRRIIVFVVIGIGPVVHAPMRFWYRPESPTSIAARLKSTAPWQVHEFQLDGDRLAWRYGEGPQIWRRVLMNEQPDWLDAMLATQHSKMDAQNQLE
jgi:hypothetical protein